MRAITNPSAIENDNIINNFAINCIVICIYNKKQNTWIRNIKTIIPAIFFPKT